MNEDRVSSNSVDANEASIVEAGVTTQEAQSEQVQSQQAQPEKDRHSVVPLLVIVAAVIAASVVTNTFNTTLVVVSIVVMVMIHEFGHYLTAKWSGMKVTEYFLGFGPRIWSFKRGETEYGIKAIPAGGYVRITGMSNLEQVDPEDEPRAYRNQSYWKKMVVVGAGSFMHFVMAFLILFGLFGIIGMRPAAVIGALPDRTATSPARDGGLREGDRIVSIDNVAVESWIDLQVVVRERPGRVVDVVALRDGRETELSIALADLNAMPQEDLRRIFDANIDPTSIGYLGARRGDVYLTEPIPQAFVSSAKLMVEASQMALGALVDRFSPSGIESIVRQVRDARSNGEARAQAEANNQPMPVTETDEDDARLVSPLGLVNFSHQAAEAGIRPVLQFLFSVNLFVGIFNLIPLMPFDGGHMAVATYEKLRSLRGRRHQVDYAKLVPVSYAVLLVLITMSLSALWLDAWYPVKDLFG